METISVLPLADSVFTIPKPGTYHSVTSAFIGMPIPILKGEFNESNIISFTFFHQPVWRFRFVWSMMNCQAGFVFWSLAMTGGVRADQSCGRISLVTLLITCSGLDEQ